MKKQPLSIKIRRTVQLVFLALFILTILQATYPFQPWLPPELFLWADPLAALSTQIAGRFFEPLFLIALIVLLSPFVIGRAFCGWVCPLGTTIDVTDRWLAKKKNRSTRNLRKIKTVALVLLLLLALFGIQLSWLLDPLPILWRSLGIIGMALFFLFSEGIFNGLYATGIFSDVISSVQDKITSYLFPLSAPTFLNLLIPIIIIVVILGLAKISRRFWCRNLCPLGALLGLVAKFSPLQRFVNQEFCSSCAICWNKCKMDAIEKDFVTTEKSECILCLDCSRDCPEKAITYSLHAPTRMQSSMDLSRRSFLGAGIAALLSSGLFAITGINPTKTNRRIRPPGSLIEDNFLEHCIRCEECVRICATSGGCLQMSFLESGLAGMLTPIAKYRLGYCEYNCNLCGQICPTKAIQPLELAEKQEWKMGTAFFLQDRCIPYRLNQDCLVCEEHCPLPEKAIKLTAKEYIDPETGTKRMIHYPYIDSDLCTGCGICENKCPLEGEAAIVIYREGEERKIA